MAKEAAAAKEAVAAAAVVALLVAPPPAIAAAAAEEGGQGGLTPWAVKVAIAEMLHMNVKLSIEETIVAGCKKMGIAPFVVSSRFKWKLGVMAADLEFATGW